MVKEIVARVSWRPFPVGFGCSFIRVPFGGRFGRAAISRMQPAGLGSSITNLVNSAIGIDRPDEPFGDAEVQGADHSRVRLGDVPVGAVAEGELSCGRRSFAGAAGTPSTASDGLEDLRGALVVRLPDSGGDLGADRPPSADRPPGPRPSGRASPRARGTRRAARRRASRRGRRSRSCAAGRGRR